MKNFKKVLRLVPIILVLMLLIGCGNKELVKSKNSFEKIPRPIKNTIIKPDTNTSNIENVETSQIDIEEYTDEEIKQFIKNNGYTCEMCNTYEIDLNNDGIKERLDYYTRLNKKLLSINFVEYLDIFESLNILDYTYRIIDLDPDDNYYELEFRYLDEDNKEQLICFRYIDETLKEFELVG